jgi:hypothetical protein
MVSTTTELWLSSLPSIITSLTTLVVAVTGFRQMQKNHAAAAAKAEAIHQHVKAIAIALNVPGEPQK